MRLAVLSLASLATLFPVLALAQAVPITSPVPTTKVMAIGRVVGARDSGLRQIMPDEVRDTVQLYLDGKLDQWFVKQDGTGVVFLLNASSEAEAKAMLSNLPLVKAGRMEFDLTPLGPLSPLRYLMGAPGSAPKP